MTIQIEKKQARVYVSDDRSGLDVWDDNLSTLLRGIEIIEGKGKLYLSNQGLVEAMEKYPQIIIEALKTEAQLQLSIIDARGTNPMDIAIKAGGYGLINQTRLNYIDWLNTPNIDRGGH